MIEIRKRFDVNDAVQRIMKHATTGSLEWIPIEQADGRFMGEDLVAEYDLPFTDQSREDGFAINIERTYSASSTNPVTFNVTQDYSETIKSNEAVRVKRDSAIPFGCSAVIKWNEVDEFEKNGRKYISITKPVQIGDNLSFRGEEIRKGTVIVKRGSYINSGVIATLATFGYKYVPVFKRPSVGLIETSSDDISIIDPMQSGKTRNSSYYMAYAQIKRVGGKPVNFEKLSSDFYTNVDKVKQALKHVDFLLLIGESDQIPQIYKKLKVNLLVDRNEMISGSIATVAEIEGKIIFTLSKKPTSCYIGIEMFVRPLIRTYQLSEQPQLKTTVATLSSDIQKKDQPYVLGKLEHVEGKLMFTPIEQDQVSSITSLILADALMIVSDHTYIFNKGSEIRVWLLDDSHSEIVI